MIGQIRADRKRSGRGMGGGGSVIGKGLDLNLGRLYHNGAVCWHTAHKDIGTNEAHKFLLF